LRPKKAHASITMMLTTVLYTIAAVVVADWLFVGKLVAGFANFDYRYWPPAWPRVLTLVLAAITASVSALVLIPGAMPVWPLFVWALVFGLWIVAAINDLAHQRRLGYREPPRYSDGDD
jgi:hypothetical protein